ncbi:HAD family phosphatase [Streptomyces sp. Tu102]|uniref:HAD family hydrolase n=1 Tax=Streptomyces sp. Tu102 TaxID=2838019 RepID=UPI001BDBF423|nr:HAD family phosphatase [Streptomyces sp. Tu102]MBT1093898.1 HAD family phosphatase [Streptomyces sp. Tu102]
MSGLSGMSVVFDLDGTLVDSEPNYFEAGRQVLAEHGVPDFTWADHERYVGISTLETVTLWKREYGLRASVEELLAAKNRRYLELARTATRAYPEMRKFVELLATEAVPMAVASGSSSEAITAILAGTGLDGQLRTVVSADEVAHGKPAPDVFLEAAARLGADPADCVVVEDAAPGAAAAHAAGMRCFAVPYVAAQADAPEFATAGLLVRGGQAEFTARAAYDWLVRAANSA